MSTLKKCTMELVLDWIGLSQSSCCNLNHTKSKLKHGGADSSTSKKRAKQGTCYAQRLCEAYSRQIHWPALTARVTQCAHPARAQRRSVSVGFKAWKSKKSQLLQCWASPSSPSPRPQLDPRYPKRTQKGPSWEPR